MKQSYSIVSFDKADEKQKEEYLRVKQLKRIRIISGGHTTDFEEMSEALKYLEKSCKVYSYASINVVYPGLLNGDR